MSTKAAVLRDIVIMAVLIIGPLVFIIGGGWTVLSWLGADEPAPTPVGNESPLADAPDAPLPAEVGGLGMAGEAVADVEPVVDAPGPDPDALAVPTDVDDEGDGLPFVDKLKKRHIVAGVKSNIGTLIPCIEEARDSGLITAAKARVTVDFIIEPAGSVSDAKLRKPKRLRETVVAACVTSAIEEWRFPPSTRGAPVKGLPIPMALK